MMLLPEISIELIQLVMCLKVSKGKFEIKKVFRNVQYEKSWATVLAAGSIYSSL
jgi:hypothetical protein